MPGTSPSAYVLLGLFVMGGKDRAYDAKNADNRVYTNMGDRQSRRYLLSFREHTL
jgi:hypothetical protein